MDLFLLKFKDGVIYNDFNTVNLHFFPFDKL